MRFGAQPWPIAASSQPVFTASRPFVLAQEGAGAQWWAPGESVRQPPLELAEDDAAAAEAWPLIEKHRVATAPIEGLEPRVAEAVLAAKLRHELEHARQWEACGPEPFFLMQLAIEVHRR